MANTYDNTDWSTDSLTKASATSSTTNNVSLTGTLSVNNNSANPLYVSTTDDNPLKLERTGSSANVSIQFKNDEGDPWYMGKASNGGFGISDGGADLASATYSKVYIDSSGNVGIGTTSPSKTLSIHAGSGGQVAINREDADNAIIANDEIGRISFGGDDPTNETFQVGAAILVAGDGTWASNDCPARIQFYTCDDGSNTLDARMTIKESGSIGIGTATPSTLLHVVGSTTNALVTIESTGTTSDDAAPELVLKRNADLTDGGNVGVIRFNGLDDGANETIYSSIYSEINDETNTTEDGNFYIQNMIAGTLTNVVSIVKDDVTFAGKIVEGRTVIKVPATLFVANDDADGVSHFVGSIEDDGSNFGMRATNATLEFFAYVDVPLGYTATKVQVNGSDTANEVEVYTLDLDDGTIGSEISNSGLTVGDNTVLGDNHVGSDTNMLLIKVETTATDDLIYGGYVTIQPS